MASLLFFGLLFVLAALPGLVVWSSDNTYRRRYLASIVGSLAALLLCIFATAIIGLSLSGAPTPTAWWVLKALEAATHVLAATPYVVLAVFGVHQWAERKKGPWLGKALLASVLGATLSVFCAVPLAGKLADTQFFFLSLAAVLGFAVGPLSTTPNRGLAILVGALFAVCFLVINGAAVALGKNYINAPDDPVALFFWGLRSGVALAFFQLFFLFWIILPAGVVFALVIRGLHSLLVRGHLAQLQGESGEKL